MYAPITKDTMQASKTTFIECEFKFLFSFLE